MSAADQDRHLSAAKRDLAAGPVRTPLPLQKYANIEQNIIAKTYPARLMAANREERFLERQRGAGARDINLAFDLELPGITRVSKTPLKPQKSGRSKKTPQAETLPPRSTRKTPKLIGNVPALPAGQTPATTRRRTIKAKETAGTASGVEVVAQSQALEAVEQAAGGASTKKRKALDDIPETETASPHKKRRKRKSIGQQTLKRKPRPPLKPKNSTELTNTALPGEETEDADTKSMEVAAEESNAIGEGLAKPKHPTGVAQRTGRTQTTRKPPGRKPVSSSRTQESKTKPPPAGQEMFEEDIEPGNSVHEPAKVESPIEPTAPAETDKKPKPRKRKRKAIVQSPRKRKKPAPRESALGSEEIAEVAMAESQEEPAIIPTAAVAFSDRKTNKRGRKPKSVPGGHAEPSGQLFDTSQTTAKAEPVQLQQSQPDNELAAISQIIAAASVDKNSKKKGRKPKSAREQQAAPSKELIDPSPTTAEAELAQAEQYRPENEQRPISSATAAAPLHREGRKRGRKPNSALQQQPGLSEIITSPLPTVAEAELIQVNQSQQENKLPATNATDAAVSIESKGKKRGRKPKLMPNEKPDSPEEIIDPSPAPAEAEPAQTEQAEAGRGPAQPIEDPVPSKRNGRKRKSIGQVQRPRKKATVKTAPEAQSDTETTHPEVQPIDPPAAAAPAPKRKGRPKKSPVVLQRTEHVPVEPAVPEKPQPAVASKKRGRPKQPVSTASEAKPEDTIQQRAESVNPEKPPVKQSRKKIVQPIPPNEPDPPAEKPYAPTATLEPEPHLSPPVKKRGRPKKQAPANPPSAEVSTKSELSDRPKAQPKRRAPKALSTGTTKAPMSAPDPAMITTLDPVRDINDLSDPLSDHAPNRSRLKPGSQSKFTTASKPRPSLSQQRPPNTNDAPSNQATTAPGHHSLQNNPSPSPDPAPSSTTESHPLLLLPQPQQHSVLPPNNNQKEHDLQARLASLSASVKKRKAEMGAKMINAPPPTSAPAPSYLSLPRSVATKPNRGLEGFVFSRVKTKRRKVLGVEERGEREGEDEIDPGLQALLSRVKGVGGGAASGLVRTS